jgi:secreted trypsin-like serine protease
MQGDQGSPLIVAGLQVAMNSFTFTGCDPNYPTAFTRVQYYYDWIKANTNLP